MAEILDIVVRQRGARRVAKDIATIAVSANSASLALKKLGIDLRNTNTAMRTATTSATQFSTKVSTTGTASTAAAVGVGTLRTSMLGIGAAATLAGGALVRGFLGPLKSAISVAGEFESAMNLTAILTNVERGTEAFSALESRARSLGSTTRFTAVEVSEGMSFLAKTGLDAAATIGAIPSTIEIASAAQIDLGRASDITTNILKGFRIELSKLPQAVDILAQTFSSSNVNIEQMAQSFQAVGPIAAEFNQKFEDIAAVVGALGNSGIQAEKAGIALRRIFINLQTDAGKTASILRKFGIDIRDEVTGQFRPLIEIFREIGEAGLQPAQTIDLFGARALAAAGIIENAAPVLNDFAEMVKNSIGRGAEIAEAQLKGFNGQMIKLKSALEGLRITIAQSGFLEFFTKIAKQLTLLTREMIKLPRPVLQMVGLFFALAGALGAILVPLGLMTFGFAVMAPLLGGVSFAGLLSGLSTAALLIVPVVVGVKVLIRIWDNLKDKQIEVGESTLTMRGIMAEAASTIGGHFAKLPGQIALSFNLAIDSMNTFIDRLLDFEEESDKVASTAPANLAVKAIATVNIIGRVFIEVFKKIGVGLWNLLTNFTKVFTVIPELMSAAFDDDAGTTVGTVLAQNFKEGFFTEFEGGLDFLPGLIEDEMAKAKSAVSLFGASDFAKRAEARSIALITPGVAPSADGSTGTTKGGKTGDSDVFTANQEAALRAVERLTATYRPGRDAILEYETALRTLNSAVDLKVISDVRALEVQKELKEEMGEKFIASIDPVAKVLKDQADAFMQLEVSANFYNLSVEQTLELERLLFEQTQARLLQLDEYQRSLTMLQGLQMGALEGLKEFAKQGGTQFGIVKAGVIDLGNTITGALTDAITEGEFSFKKFALEVVSSIQQILIKLLIQIALQTILNGLSGGFGSTISSAGAGGGRALTGGGGALALSPLIGAAGGANVGPSGIGRPMIVGEEGPEIFTPRVTGSVIPNGQSAALAAAPVAPPQVNVQVVNVTDPSEVIDVMSTTEGSEVIVNALVAHKNTIREILG
jgi:TP901 family phage tail tape measure protein